LRLHLIIMEYIFYSYYIESLLKGKLKAIQISIAVSITLMVVFVNAGGFINYIIGKSDSIIDLLFLVFFIYSLMNVGYAAFNRYAPLPVANAAGTEKSKDASYSILQNKSYGSTVKTSPKATGTKTENAMVPARVKSAKEEISVPGVEINIESTEEFFEDEKEEWNEKYSGVINENHEIDITDVPHENEDHIRKNTFK
jgi:hypothetical protein